MIGLKIAKLLKDSATLLALVPANNIYPYIANENTPLPLIIYTIDSIDSEYTKDGWCDDLVSFSIVTAGEDYANIQAIATEIRKALEMKFDSGTKRIILIGFQEGYNISENAFMNKLSFKVEVTSY